MVVKLDAFVFFTRAGSRMRLKMHLELAKKGFKGVIFAISILNLCIIIFQGRMGVSVHRNSF